MKIFSMSKKDWRHGRPLEELVSEHTNGGISIVKDMLVFVQSSATRPNELFTFDLLSKDAYPRQRTRFNEQHLTETLTSDPEVGVDSVQWLSLQLTVLFCYQEFWFKGANGDKVMGWLFKPVSFDISATRQYPLAFLIHGGPEGAWNDGWGNRYVFSFACLAQSA